MKLFKKYIYYLNPGVRVRQPPAVRKIHKKHKFCPGNRWAGAGGTLGGG